MVVLQDKGRPEVAQKKPCQSEVSVFNKVYKGTKVDSKSSLIIFGGNYSPSGYSGAFHYFL